MVKYLKAIPILWNQFKRAWKGEIHIGPPPKIFLLGCGFGIVPNPKLPKNTIVIACHPQRQHEILKAFQEATAKYDKRVGPKWKEEKMS